MNRDIQKTQGERSTGRSEPRQAGISNFRKWLLLVVGVIFLLVGLYFHFLGDRETGSQFASNSVLRIGIVLIALWLALPTLRKPLAWLPPGIVAACLVGIGVIAAQPRLIVVLAPAAGILLAVAGFARFFRRR